MNRRMKDSHIEWTDHTFNPWIRCTKVSPGCEHCYAEVESKRRNWAQWGNGKPRMRTSPEMWKEPLRWNKEALKARERRRVFCASLADVFDEEVDPQWRADLWCMVQKTPQLMWLILTKRTDSIAGNLPEDWGEGWPNVCLMTSVEDQTRAARIGTLIEIPARFRGVSIEPLLAPVTLEPKWLEKLNWVIVGGESGPKARPMHPQWALSLRDQCRTARTKFLFKQWGAGVLMTERRCPI